MPKRGEKRKSSANPDFEKKKRKVGKGKQLPENVTQLNFKSKSIVVPSQLEESASQVGPTTHKKHGFQTLMVQLKHYRLSVRHDALIGLRELLQANQDLLAPNLAKLVEQGMPVMVDDSSRVRHAFHALLNFILSNATSDQLSPFSPLIVAHLRCGLTHINDQIQLDTLKTFGLFLKQPTLIMPFAYQLLSLLMKLISRQQAYSALTTPKCLLNTTQEAKSKLGAGQSTTVTALTIDPDSKLANLKSRLEIFTLLFKFIDTILASNNRGTGELGQARAVQQAQVDTVEKCVYFYTPGVNLIETCSTLADFSTPVPHVLVLKSAGIFPPSHTPFRGDLDLSKDVNVSLTKNQRVEVIQSLLSLLLESWIECSPVNQRYSGKSSSKDTVFSLMEVILKLVSQVLQLVLLTGTRDSPMLKSEKEECSLKIAMQKFFSEFKIHFVSCFPFSSKLPFNDSDLFQTYFDLLICLDTVKLMEILYVKGTDSSSVKTLEKICIYLGHKLEVSHTVPVSQYFQNCVQVLVAFLPALLKLTGCVKLGDSCVVPRNILREMISGVWDIYSICHPLSRNKQLFLECFSELLRKELTCAHSNERSLVMSHLLLPWLHTLPDLYVKSRDSDSETLSLVICSMTMAAVYSDGDVCSALEKMVDTIFTTANSILTKLSGPTQRSIVEMLWHLPDLFLFKNEFLSGVTECVNLGVLNRRVVVYLIQTIHHKFIRQASECDEQFLAPYLSFLFSVIVGHSRHSLRVQQGHSHLTRLAQPALSISTSDGQQDYGHTARVVKVVCECLMTLSSSSQILHLLEPSVLNIVNSTSVFPLNTVVSLLSLGLSLIPNTYPAVSKDLTLFFARLCLSLLVTIEMNSEPSSLIPKEAVTKYVALAHQFLCCSETLLTVFLEEVPNIFPRQSALSCKVAFIKTFTHFVTSTHVTVALRMCKSDLQRSTTKLLDMMMQENVESEIQLLVSDLEVASERIHAYAL